MKIENNVKPVVVEPIVESEPRPARRATPGASASADVQLSSLATHIGEAQQALSDAPVVNAERVAELTQAIRENRFSVDASKVADKLVSMAAELIRANRG